MGEVLFARGDRVRFSRKWFEHSGSDAESGWRGKVISAPEGTDIVRVKWDHRMGSDTYAAEFLEEIEESKAASA